MITKDKFLDILKRDETNENLADLERYIKSILLAEEKWAQSNKAYYIDLEKWTKEGHRLIPGPPEKPKTDREAYFGSSLAEGSSMNFAGAALLSGKPQFFKKIVELIPELLFAHSYKHFHGDIRKWKTPLEIAIDTGDVGLINWILTIPNKNKLMQDANAKHQEATRHDMAYYEEYASQKARDCKEIQRTIEAAAESAERLPKNDKDYKWHVANVENKIGECKAAWSDEAKLAKCVETIESLLAEIAREDEEQEVVLGEVNLAAQYENRQMELLKPLTNATFKKITYLTRIDDVCTTLENAIKNRNLAGVMPLFNDGGISSNTSLIERNLIALREAEHIEWEDSKARSFEVFIEEAKKMEGKAKGVMEALKHPKRSTAPQFAPVYASHTKKTKQEHKASNPKPYNTASVTRQVYVQTLKEVFTDVGFNTEAEDINAEVQRVIQEKYSDTNTQDTPGSFLRDLNQKLIAKLEEKAHVKQEATLQEKVELVVTQEAPLQKSLNPVVTQEAAQAQSLRHIVKALGHDIDWFMEHLDDELMKADKTLSCLDTIREKLQDTSFQERVYTQAAKDTVQAIDSSTNWDSADLAGHVLDAINKKCEENQGYREQVKSSFLDTLVKHLKAELDIKSENIQHTEKSDLNVLFRILTGATLGLAVGLGALYLLHAKTSFPKEAASNIGFAAAFSLAGGIIAYLSDSATVDNIGVERG